MVDGTLEWKVYEGDILLISLKKLLQQQITAQLHLDHSKLLAAVNLNVA